MQTDPDERRRLINSWNAARHGWDRFQASNRRIATRLIRADPPSDLDTSTGPSPATEPGINR